MSRSKTNLTDVWHGLYSYPRFLEPVYFVATLISFGNSFSGTTHEAMEGKSAAPLQLFATLEGDVKESDVNFTKSYDGTQGWGHSVLYQGRIAGNGTEIEGKWTIPGVWSGRFLMLRGYGATEHVARKTFARV